MTAKRLLPLTLFGRERGQGKCTGKGDDVAEGIRLQSVLQGLFLPAKTEPKTMSERGPEPSSGSRFLITKALARKRTEYSEYENLYLELGGPVCLCVGARVSRCCPVLQVDGATACVPRSPSACVLPFQEEVVPTRASLEQPT